jgi:hypothetical protein
MERSVLVDHVWTLVCTIDMKALNTAFVGFGRINNRYHLFDSRAHGITAAFRDVNLDCRRRFPALLVPRSKGPCCCGIPACWTMPSDLSSIKRGHAIALVMHQQSKRSCPTRALRLKRRVGPWHSLDGLAQSSPHAVDANPHRADDGRAKWGQ